MNHIIRTIKPGERVLIFLDYDGTLVSIKKTPKLARLRPSRRRLLERLSRRAFVCIVSGRSVADLQRLVAVEGIAYVGNHGLELAYGGKIWIHPRVKKIRPILAKVLTGIRIQMSGLPGMIVEDKGLTGSVHYRLLPPALRRPLKKVILSELGPWKRELKLMEGKKVFEIRPSLGWNKGKGILELFKRLDLEGRPRRIYIGDDRTDEDAFRSFGKEDITILVGRRKNSRARFRLDNVNRVWEFLKNLFDLMSKAETAARPKARAH